MVLWCFDDAKGMHADALTKSHSIWRGKKETNTDFLCLGSRYSLSLLPPCRTVGSVSFYCELYFLTVSYVSDRGSIRGALFATLLTS
jgi:hypothetical protein